MKLNKSFSRRIGKSLSPSQQDLLANMLPKYLFDPITLNSTQKHLAEVGIGMGDHFVARATKDKDALHLGFEPYLNGVANSLRLATEAGIENIRLWPDDMDLIFDKIPDALLDEIYILFPDPWPKSRHHKRRIINSTRLKLFAQKLNPPGVLYFASDIDHYFDSALKEIEACGYFENIKAGDEPPVGYIKTRYNLKAEEEGRKSRFLQAKKASAIMASIY